MIGRSAARRARSPAIEGVVVLGMHRSGTSVVTRLASLLGLSLCHPDDLLAGFPGNPRGHWESKALVSFNTRLLTQLGGTWFCPPPLGAAEIAARLRPQRKRALTLLQRSHPQRPYVWKDPRACLLMPFWAEALQRSAVHILVARHPMEVAESLARRNGFPPAHGLALWERYTRLALRSSEGRPTVLCTYDEVLREPVAWCRRLASFLGELGVGLPGVEEAPISAFVAGELRRAERSWEQLGPAELFGPQRLALAALTARTGMHPAFAAPVLPEEAPETAATLAEIRRASSGRRSAAARLAAGTARPEPREDPRPPASLVIATGGGGLAAESVSALSSALPAGSEVLDTDGHSSPAEEGSGSATLAHALEEASGRTVVLLSSAAPLGKEWYTRLQAALASSKAGCVGAVLLLQEGRRPAWGAFADRDLEPTLVAASAARSGLAAAPLLCGGLCAYVRRVLSAAGGLDPEFDTVRAALAELSLRLWRMGFSSFALAGLEVGQGQLKERASLYDRLRLAALHLDGVPLREFELRARSHPGYDAARARLQRSDLAARRALTDAVCAFSAARYFEEFPLGRGPLASRLHRTRLIAARAVRRWRLLTAANGPGGSLELGLTGLTGRLRGGR